MRKMSNSDRRFWTDYGINPGVPSDGSLTTEQLADAMLESIQQMTPQEKAELRRVLDASFGRIQAKWRRPGLAGGRVREGFRAVSDDH